MSRLQHYSINVIASNGYKMKVAEAYSKGIAYIIAQTMKPIYHDQGIITVENGFTTVYTMFTDSTAEV